MHINGINRDRHRKNEPLMYRTRPGAMPRATIRYDTSKTAIMSPKSIIDSQLNKFGLV